MQRRWAFWRRVQYGGGAAVLLLALMVWAVYALFFSTPPSCSDGRQNGDERGVDCGGACALVCAFDAEPPAVLWAEAFRITDDRYHAVAYLENRNRALALPELPYTFTLYDADGAVIAERSGVTPLPPDGRYPLFEANVEVGARVPVRAELSLGAVAVWVPQEPAPEVRFEVRSRTLSGADERPRLEALLYNTSLDEASDVEIIATIFDAAGTPLTASRSFVERFGGREERRVVFTWPEPIATTVRSCEVPSDVVVAIDLSGSMNDDGATPPEPLTSVLDAARSFTSRLSARDQIGVVTYATDAARPLALGSDTARAEAVIRGLTIAPAEETGATNIGEAIRAATTELTSERHSPDARAVLILLTDGRATAPDAEPEEYALAAARDARDAGITVFTIGLGEQVNTDFLAALAGDEAYRYLAADRSDLDRIYRAISTALCEDGPAVIDIIPKVPGDVSSL